MSVLLKSGNNGNHGLSVQNMNDIVLTAYNDGIIQADDHFRYGQPWVGTTRASWFLLNAKGKAEG